MKVLDLFAGTGSATQAFVDAGHDVFTVELAPDLEADLHADIMTLDVDEIRDDYDFIWASPPCTAFSVASIPHHWTGGKRAYIPKTEAAVLGQKLVSRTIDIISELNPGAWLMENPRGVLRKLPVVEGLPRQTVTYCQYGDTRMKPTDLWGVVPGWTPRPMCKNGQPCHEAAPRGAQTGTQGLSLRERSMVPYELGAEIVKALS